MLHPESARPRRAARAAATLVAVGAAVVLALIVGATMSSAATSADEITGTGVSTAAAGPALQLFGVPLAAALWLLAGVVAATVGLVASRRPRPVRTAQASAVTPVDGARA